MGLELAKKEIDGHVYEFEQFGAKKSTKLLVRLSKMIGRPMAILAGEITEKGGLDKVDLTPDFLSAVVGALMEKADENEVLDLLEQFCSQKVMCDGKLVNNFDKHYENRLDHMFKVLWAALEVQYGNFFGALNALQGNFRKQSPITTQDQPM